MKRWHIKSGFNFPCLALTLIQVVQCRNFLKQSLILQVTANSPASVPHGHTWSQISAAVNIARWACGVRTPSQLPQPKCTFWVKQRTCIADPHSLSLSSFRKEFADLSTVAILFCSFEVLEVKFETFLSNLEIVELEEFVARRLENL